MQAQEHLPGAGAPLAQRKSDGQDGPPLLPQANSNSNGPNAALKEAPPKPGEGVDPNHPHRGHLAVLNADAGYVQETAPDGSPRKSIAICGFASSTRHAILARAQDPGWSIWGLNQLYRHIPRADRWFDIHYNWDQETVPGTDHRKWAQECGIPFYTTARQYDVPTNVRYPLERLIAKFEADYFTSTIPYMLALAIDEIDAMAAPEIANLILEGKSLKALAQRDLPAEIRKIYGQYTIGIYGIDLVVGGEYFQEKPCAEFWIGAAALGRGIRVEIPKESALCKQLYRYGTEPEPNQIIKRADIDAHTQHVAKQRDEMLKQLYMMEGVLQANARWGEVYDLRQRGAKVE